MTTLQTFVEPNTSIMINVPWEPPNIYYLMPVVAYCIEATLWFDVLNGAN